MRIAVVGGGPGGLYFSILTRRDFPDAHIDVFERNKPDDSFGFGVVFSDETLSEFLTRDTQSYELIRRHFAYWDELDIARNGEKTRITGNGFCGCSRKTLLKLLHQRCREEGVNLHFEHEVAAVEELQDYDLIVAADGIGSRIRESLQKEFGTQVQMQQNRFVWCGSTRPLDAFTYWFRETEHGPIVAHTYQYEAGQSTWIFECSNETWEKWGFEVENEQASLATLEKIFAEELQGHALISNKSHWRQFPHVTNARWHHNNIVLLGDAKATAHFSIGSGTKLAMESAISLADAVVDHRSNLPAVFSEYERQRRTRVEIIQHAANVSLDWFEHMDRHIRHPFFQFAFSVMTRAKKVTYDNLRLRDPAFVQRVVEEHLDLQKGNTAFPSPAFQPYTIGSLKLHNRVGMSSMSQGRATEGCPTDWHLVHYGSRAVSGLGFITSEATAVVPEGRIGDGCTGLYNAEQVQAWKHILDYVHAHSECKMGVQLSHAGRKAQSASTGPNNLIAASAIPWDENCPVPRAMDAADMQNVATAFADAAQRAHQAGFDYIELQAHHGFLLGSFASPLTNRRQDEYGGPIQQRMRFPLEVYRAVNKAFPGEVWVRISATDWAEGGLSESDCLAMVQLWKEAGVKIINVSTGKTVKNEQPPGGRMWQVPFSDLVKNEGGVATITTGGISEVDQVNTLLLNRKADLVALGSCLLSDPYWMVKARVYEGTSDTGLPSPYHRADSSYVKQVQSDKRQLEKMKAALKPKSHKA